MGSALVQDEALFNLPVTNGQDLISTNIRKYIK